MQGGRSCSVVRDQETEPTNIFSAARSGNVAAIEKLFRPGERTEYNGWTPVHLAARHGHAGAVEALIRLGSADLDTPDNDLMTPMHYAAFYRHAAVIDALIRLGSRAVDLPDKDGATPLRSAIAGDGPLEAVEILIQLGRHQSLGAVDGGGCTLLCDAASWGEAAVIEMLVRHDSWAIDVPNKDGKTPICLAAEALHKDCVRLLMALGASTACLPHLETSKAIARLARPPSEDESAEVRHRVFFARSLVARLLFELGR